MLEARDFLREEYDPGNWIERSPRSRSKWLATRIRSVDVRVHIKRKFNAAVARLTNIESAGWREHFVTIANQVAAAANVIGWNGPGTRAVRTDAVARIEPLAQLLPAGLPEPDASVSSFGSLSFDWAEDPDWQFTITLSDENSLGFSALLANETIRGKFPFDAERLPSELLAALEKWMAAERI